MTLKWKLIFISVGVLLLVFGISYGYKQYAYHKERSVILEKQEEIVKDLEKADLEHVKEEERLLRLLADREKQISLLDKKIDTLETQITNIVVPSDPNALVDAFHKRGFRSARIVIQP